MKNFKSLPKKTKNLLNLGLIVFLVIVLPLLVWAIINLNFNQREKAASGEPPQTMQINWTTPDITITADEFYINSGSKTYYGDLQNVSIIPSVIDTGPNPIRWASIEIQSTQHGDDLRMKVYFKSNGSTWNVDSVGVLNSNYSSGWITYDNDLIYTVLGHAYYHEGVLDFVLNDPNTGQMVANVHSKNLRIHAFTSATPPPTACPNVPFSLEVTPSTQIGVLGQTLRYNITVKNNDSTCGPLGTYLVVDKPSNWIANFGIQNFSLPYNLPYSTYLDVTSPTTNYYIGNQPITVRVNTVNAGNSNSKTVIYNLTYPTSPSPSPTPKIGDVNGDNKVNMIDISMVIDDFDSTNPANPMADINGNGKVDLIDIGLIIDNYEW